MTDLHRPLVEGPLSLDLVNTAWRDDDLAVDWLGEDEGVVRFCAERGHDVASDEIDATRAALVEVRELVRRLLRATVDGTLDDELAREVDDGLRRATVRLDRTQGSGLVITGTGIERVAVEALVDAVEVVGELDGRLRSCADGECTLWFVDTSRAGTRKWCSMQRCGNRAKARRYHERHAPG